MAGVARGWVAHDWGAPETWTFDEFALADPQQGEISLRIMAAGVNPADAKHVAVPRPGATLPVRIGYEVSGVVTAVGPDTTIGSGPVRVGDEVLAFRVSGGYATHVTIPSVKAFHKPATLSHPEAANLLLAGTTAAEMLALVNAAVGDAILVHGASGAVGASVIQQAQLAGVRVIGTARESRLDRVAQFGATAVAYGPGLAERIRRVADERIVAALDLAGSTEALDVSLDLVRDRSQIITIANAGRAKTDGIRWIAGSVPGSAAFRDTARRGLIDLAASGKLAVPMDRFFPLEAAPEAYALLASGQASGKLALDPWAL